MTNPLLQTWDTPFGMPPFDRIRDDDIPGAFDAALEEARANVARVAADPETPTFANTVEALELADERLSRVHGAVLDAGRDRVERRARGDAAGVLAAGWRSTRRR